MKILDFGLALRRLELPSLDSDGPTMARTAPHVVLGTLGYMSPEQVTGDRVDGRSDLFALGCVLYEMLSGRALFAGSTPQEIVAQLVHDRVPELPEFDALAPTESAADRAHAASSGCRRGDYESASDLATGAACAAQRIHRHRHGSGGRESRGKSLAVLPFVNAGADPATEYLTDGITESIINSVSQLERPARRAAQPGVSL